MTGKINKWQPVLEALEGVGGASNLWVLLNELSLGRQYVFNQKVV